MARLYLFSQPGTMLNVLYTVEHAVGRGHPNKRDDVALVQFLVRRVLEGWNDLPSGVPLLNILSFTRKSGGCASVPVLNEPLD